MTHQLKALANGKLVVALEVYTNSTHTYIYIIIGWL